MTASLGIQQWRGVRLEVSGDGPCEAVRNEADGPGARKPPRPGSAARALGDAAHEPFAVDIQWRDGVAIVRPCHELDLATVETLRAALDGIKGAARLVLDMRDLSFIDSTGVHLLIELHQRARREGFELSLVAPAPPGDRAIQICGLDKVLPFVDAA